MLFRSEVVTDPRVAAARESFIVPPKKFVLGETAAAFATCEHVFEGRTEQNGQEHLYIETQGAYAVPMENGGIRVYSSTQGPTAVQRAVCRVTGLPMHKVEVDVQRLEGKRKLSQNREARDIDGAMRTLHERGREDLAVVMKINQPSDK